MTSLAKTEKGKKFKVCDIISDKLNEVNLMNLGISQGIILEVVRKSPLKGPLIVSFGGSEIAIGYNLAEKIFGKRV